MRPEMEVHLQFDSWTHSFCARNDMLTWFLLQVSTTSNVLLVKREVFQHTKKGGARVSAHSN